MSVVTEQEFEEWLQSPVTKKIKNKLEEQIEAIKVGLLNDTYEDSRKARGSAIAYQNIVDLTYGDLYE